MSSIESIQGGVVAISCAVLMRTGVRVPDVIWASSESWRGNESAYLLERAPQLCVEVCSSDGEEKVPAYLAAGAREVWVISEDASIRYFNHSGELAMTEFPILLAWPPALEWAL